MSDLIDRQAAIEALCDNCDHTQAVCAHYPCKQYIAVRKLPSAQPEHATCYLDSPCEYQNPGIKIPMPTAEPQWIPCSERLPDREGRYLVTLPLVNGYPWLKILRYGVPDFDEEYRRRCWYETGDYCDIAANGIVAWMPLPKPYEERREDDGTD